MAGDGYHRLLVSGIRTLTATSAVEQMHEDSPMKSTSDCLEKLAACQDDDVCGSCITNYDSPEYQQRIESARNAIRSSGTSSVCHDFDFFPCCKDDVPEHACMENDSFVEYMQCHV